MRVLYIEGGRNLYGGLPQVVYLVKGLEKKGIKNTVLCHENTMLRKLDGNAEIITTSYSRGLDIRIFSNSKTNYSQTTGFNSYSVEEGLIFMVVWLRFY